MQINFARQAYQSRSLPISAQRCVNLFAESMPDDAKVPLVLHGTPGLRLFATLGAGPIRGLHAKNGVLFAVSGNTAYAVDTTGTGFSKGVVGGSDRLIMADNGTQIVAVTTTGDGYIITDFTTVPIADSDFLPASSVAYLDGYFIFSHKDSGEFFISDISDGLSYDALEFAAAESAPDNLVAAFVDHRELWLFGKTSIEVWTNTGNATFPFERVTNAILERGCIAPASIAKEDNTVWWLGDDLVVYRGSGSGYAPTRVSTHAIEFALQGFSNVADAEGSFYTQEGHKFYVLKIPDEATFVYDVSTGLWHQRQSYGQNDWAVTKAVHCYNKIFVGDDTNGNIYELDLDYYTDNGTTIERIAACPPLWAKSDRAIMSRFEVDFEAGVGLPVGQGSNPQAVLRWSDDGGRTWSNELWTSIGQLGQYRNRAVWRRLGQFRQRIMEVSVSDPVKIAIQGGYADLEMCLN